MTVIDIVLWDMDEFICEYEEDNFYLRFIGNVKDSDIYDLRIVMILPLSVEIDITKKLREESVEKFKKMIVDYHNNSLKNGSLCSNCDFDDLHCLCPDRTELNPRITD
jgi:hypothetical protein